VQPVEPGRYSEAWKHRPGFAGAQQIRSRKRNTKTTKQYGGKVNFWIRFNEEGDGLRSYDPLVVTDDKFELFAGWLLGDAAAGVRGESTDGDLNGFRSALNRYFEENGCGRPLKDSVNVEQTIRDYDLLQQQSKQARGEESKLHRVPVPESLFMHLLQLGEFAVDQSTLCWVATWFVQLLGWLRGDSVGGFQRGDVRFDSMGYLLISVRKMKMKPQFLLHPGLISIPPGTGLQHVRTRVLAIVRRALAVDSAFFAVVHAVVLEKNVAAGSDRVAAAITQELRRRCRSYVLSLPKGQTVSCHSWREMGAVSCFLAHYDTNRMAAHGFWESIGTMYGAYIKPYKSTFPYSRWLSQLFDFLRSV
jgi:hypothetical protein